MFAYVDIMKVFNGILIVRPTDEIKAMDGLARRCQKSNTRKPPSTVCSDKPKKDCTACGTLHQAGECPAVSSVCLKCNK